MMVEPEFGVEILDDSTYLDLCERVEAACNTLKILELEGLEVPEADEVDCETATTLAMAYAESVEKTSRAVTHTRLPQLTTAALRETHAILKEYGQLVAASAAELRHTVVNKLIIESNNPDARVRIKALELLGKMTDVGLFTERKEVTVTHKSSEELREKLREKLVVLKKNTDGTYE